MTDFKAAVIYQIYPRSFADSNGDGIGDLPGIIGKLDYLADLGVDVLWLSPIFASPNADNGYDIADYEVIMPEFGTMADFDALLAGVHQRGMRLILDLVVNHSSDEHRWFQESRKSKDNPYRDYYIWQAPQPTHRTAPKEAFSTPPLGQSDGSVEGPPNNWQSFFSGPAWTLDDATGEYYLHLFAEKQPDLNWENPTLRQEIYRMMRFWLDKGVDGFRMDVIPFLSKDQLFPDYPDGRFGDLSIHANGPRIHEFLREMNAEVLAHYSRRNGELPITIAEGFGVSAAQANLYVAPARRELQMIYHFDHAVPREEARFLNPAPEFTLPELKAIFARRNTALDSGPDAGGWQNIYFGNHDNPRSLSRFGDPARFHYHSATALATVLLTQRGTPNIYQGDEIGMTNCLFYSIDEYDDVQVHNAYISVLPERAESQHMDEFLESFNRAVSTFLASANLIARDHARTPMQWSAEPGAGFTTGEAWLKLNSNYLTINAEQQQQDPVSVLNFYWRLLRWRKQQPGIHTGSYHDLLPDHSAIWAFERADSTGRFITVANFSGESVAVPNGILAGEIVLGNYTETGKLGLLRAWEARVYSSSNRFTASP